MIHANLGPELEAIMAELIARGSYASENEVLAAGVRLLWEREQQIAALDASIERCMEDSAHGRGQPADVFFDALLSDLTSRREPS